MTLFLLITGLLVFFAGVTRCLRNPTGHELEQAALLPFADDPQAARAMSEATGRHCTQLVVPAAEQRPEPAGYRLKA